MLCFIQYKFQIIATPQVLYIAIVWFPQLSGPFPIFGSSTCLLYQLQQEKKLTIAKQKFQHLKS